MISEGFQEEGRFERTLRGRCIGVSWGVAGRWKGIPGGWGLVSTGKDKKGRSW
jgi:hypothetical protein